MHACGRGTKNIFQQASQVAHVHVGEAGDGPQPEANEDAGRHGFRLVGGIYIYNKICFESFVFNFFQTVLVVIVGLTGGVPLSDLWQGMEIWDRAADL